MQLDWESLNEDQQAQVEHVAFSESEYWDNEDFLREAASLSEELE